MKIIKPFFTALTTLFIGYVGYINIKLYYQPVYTAQGINSDLLKQWQFLKAKMRAGEDHKMQRLFPEGYMFMNALYGIFSAELATGLQGQHYTDVYTEGYRCYLNMDKEEARTIFPQGTPLAYGAYYNGWSAFQMGKLLQAGKGAPDEELKQHFEQRCKTIAEAMDRWRSPYLESYQNFAWPADMMLCVAALAQHDKLYTPLYKTTIDNWISKVKQRLDPLGMLPHSVNALSGEPLTNARGSSMSLMLCFLKDIDEPLYRQQLALYKKYFVTSRFGLPGIREYARGTDGDGDADSGPVILGVGGSASIVGIRVMAEAKEAPVALGLRNSVEAFGMSLQNGGEKKYLFGTLPMADAFIAWANATELSQANELTTGAGWRSGFQLYSAVIAGVCLVMLLWLWFPRTSSRAGGN